MKNHEEMEKIYGASFFENKKYIFTDDAVMAEHPVWFYPQYVTSAIDETGKEWLVFFNVKNEYVEEKFENGQFIYNVIYDEDMVEESELCDWDVIDHVKELY